MAYPVEKKGKSNILVWVIVAVAFSCLAFCGVSGYFMFTGVQRITQEMAPILGCTVEMTALRDAARTWAQQNDGKLPSAAGWKTEIREEFLKERKTQMDALAQAQGMLQIKWSNPDGPWGCPNGKGGVNAFVFNADLAGKPLQEADKTPGTVMFFEAPATTNTSEPYKPRTDKTEPKVFGELRDWMTIPVVGDLNEGISRSAGSPASRTQ